MRAVALIGGKVTWLRPITQTLPKSMVPLRNKPYVQYMVDTRKAAGLDGAIFAMGYLPDAIQRYFADQDLDGFSLDYVVEERPLGTAGGIKNAEGTSKKDHSSPQTVTCSRASTSPRSSKHM